MCMTVFPLHNSHPVWILVLISGCGMSTWENNILWLLYSHYRQCGFMENYNGACAFYVLCLCICYGSLVGPTFAYFTLDMSATAHFWIIDFDPAGNTGMLLLIYTYTYQDACTPHSIYTYMYDEHLRIFSGVNCVHVLVLWLVIRSKESLRVHSP